MKSKNAQLKIQQMAFMLMAVALFFALAGLFFLALKFTSLQKDAKLQEENKAINLVNILSRTAEFSCGGKTNCLDADKLMVLKQRPEYKDFWGVESIVVRKLYPLETEVECTDKTYPNCTTIKIFSGKSVAPISAYVALCRKESFYGASYDKCELGILMVGIKEKKA